MTIVGYARISSREQIEDSQALEQQCDRLKKAGSEKLYVDVESGSKDNRPQFNSMMEGVSKGHIKKIIITRLDRLTRSLPTLRKTIDKIEKNGCHLQALDDSIETGTAAGRFQINMLGALAEMEVDRLSERTKHGWKYLRSQRRAIKSPFGYRVEYGTHVLDTEPFIGLIETREVFSKSDLAQEVIQVFFKLKSIRAMVHHMNSKYGVHSFSKNNKGLNFTPNGFCYWFRNPVIRGHTYYPVTQEIFHDTHEKILSEEEYRDVQKILYFNNRSKRSHSWKNDCVGLVYCKRCQSKCVTKHSYMKQGEYIYFQCRVYFSQKTCENKKMIRIEKIREAITVALSQKSLEIALIAESEETNQPTTSPKIQEMENQLTSLTKIPGNNSAIQEAIAQIQNQIEAERFLLLETKEESASREMLLQAFSDPMFYLKVDEEERGRLFRELVDKVFIDEGEVVEVKLKFSS
ncbi:MAG: recombinase family protein [Roseofilum sp. SID3]|uniref:fdxN element excision recombinase XisF n=1 Tax=Roseofilum sp. SID3 TaxID=2821499 RepID=UPI001B0E4E5C|nr:fdxN element excision recombinase XisF [Roseofilum sp. SID3]MBP0015298.1 recombinase family protein [Roseofilum sp. SID3]